MTLIPLPWDRLPWIVGWAEPARQLFHVGPGDGVALGDGDGEAGHVDVAGVVEAEAAGGGDVAVLEDDALDGCSGQAMDGAHRLHVA
jgi:hypothetical protein